MASGKDFDVERAARELDDYRAHRLARRRRLFRRVMIVFAAMALCALVVVSVVSVLAIHNANRIGSNCEAINDLRDGLVRVLNRSQDRELQQVHGKRARAAVLAFYAESRGLVGPVSCKPH